MIRYTFDTEGMMTPVGNVIQHPENDNNGDVDEIVVSMLRNGVYRSIIANKSTKHIVAGNHTYLGLLELGAQFVPVIWIDVDEATELRILLADNQIARLAKPEDDRTVTLLERIAALQGTRNVEDILSGTGISQRKWEGLLQTPEPLDLGNQNAAGAEMLEHTITCPSCGHSWKRGH